jgi:DNA-binding MarR family transcriptional regulator
MYDLQFSDATLTTWALLRHTWSAMYRAAETRLDKLGISPQKLAVLWICRDYRGIPSIAEIARFCDSRSQTMVGLVNRMEEQGLVRRIRKRRGHPWTEVKLTAEGEAICRAGITLVRELIDETAPALTVEDRMQLHKLLTVLRAEMLKGLDLELDQPPEPLEEEAIPVAW